MEAVWERRFQHKERKQVENGISQCFFILQGHIWKDNARHPLCWMIIATRCSRPKKWNEGTKKGVVQWGCKKGKETRSKVSEKRFRVSSCQISFEELWGGGEKVPRHCRTSFNRGICLQLCELPGPKWRPPDGEIPEANIKVYTGQMWGAADTNLDHFVGRNPAKSL